MSDFDEGTDVGALVTRIDCLIAEIERLCAERDALKTENEQLRETIFRIGKRLQARRDLWVDLKGKRDELRALWLHNKGGER